MTQDKTIQGKNETTQSEQGTTANEPVGVTAKDRPRPSLPEPEGCTIEEFLEAHPHMFEPSAD